MTDILKASDRSRLMSKVRSRDTAPELVVRRLAHRLGFRFRLHRRSLPGCPDLVFPRYHAAVFVHGCFWHGHRGCRRSIRPTTNTAFWNEKLAGNAKRDHRNMKRLRGLGWRVLIVWECQTRDVDRLQRRLTAFLTLAPVSHGSQYGN